MAQLLHGDCLEEMKSLDDNSVDFIFCDLPYGQTSCKWDCCIDLDKFWNEIMRIKKLNTPIFMTTTTKFGVSLINTAPKKCPFRYDLVWIKSSPAGFLSAKKMPMRKHEMVYVFYEKLPLYDLSSHKHKFIDKDHSVEAKDGAYGTLQIKQPKTSGSRWDPALPTSVVKTGEVNEEYVGNYGKIQTPDYVKNNITRNKLRREYKKNGDTESTYEPPLPTSMLEIKSTRGKHSTEKPVALIEWLLKYYSKEGDIVLDATMGSGSTGVACKNMNRNFIGIEMDDEIYEVACGRIWN
tara:strand:+ start:46 stop:927 length:882 start_codon:yes stop_codon:yes gene_type:complete